VAGLKAIAQQKATSQRKSSAGSAPMDIEEELGEREERPKKSSTGSKTQRNSSRMKETPIAIRPSSVADDSSQIDAAKKLQVLLQRCESSASKSPETHKNKERVEPEEDEQPIQVDAIDHRSVGKSLKQTTIQFPSKKNLQNAKKKTTQINVRPGTPDFVPQPKSRMPQPREMQLIASDSEVEQISPEIVETIRNLSRTRKSQSQDELPRKVNVAKKRRMSVNPASSYIHAPKKPRTDGTKRSLYSTPSSPQEETEASEAMQIEDVAAQVLDDGVESPEPEIEQEEAVQHEIEEENDPEDDAAADEVSKPQKIKLPRKTKAQIAIPPREASSPRQKKSKQQNNATDAFEESQLDAVTSNERPAETSAFHQEVPVQPELPNDEDYNAMPPPAVLKKRVVKHKTQPSAKPTSKRIRRVIVHEDSDDDDSCSVPFDPYVKYDPKDNGCKREGLRVRRIGKPWWIPSGSADNIGIIHKDDTLKEMEMELEMKKIMREENVTYKQLMPNSIDQYLPKAVNLKRLKDIVKERKRLPAQGLVKGKRPSKAKESSEVNSFKNLVTVVKNSQPVHENKEDALEYMNNGKNVTCFFFKSC
jgi:hypothetical protein